MPQKQILDPAKIALIIDRLAHQLLENHGDFSSSAIIGLQPRGVLFSRRVYRRLAEILGKKDILYGELDITFYRDDFRRRDTPLLPNELRIDFIIENKKIILIDDVLFTGRSIRAALDALTAYGRPTAVELLVLIDRRYSRELPIEATYTGFTVDTRTNDKVAVDLKENTKNDAVWLITNN